MLFSVILCEAKNLGFKEKEKILRFAQNDKKIEIFIFQNAHS